jgi:hypothetical protein
MAVGSPICPLTRWTYSSSSCRAAMTMTSSCPGTAAQEPYSSEPVVAGRSSQVPSAWPRPLAISCHGSAAPVTANG